VAKKSFKGSNPALQYISSIEIEPRGPQDTQITDNTQNTPVMHNTHDAKYTSRTQDMHIMHKKETKSKRLNLLLQPSLLEDMSKVARMKQTSVNDLINKVLRDYTESEVSTIARYDEVFGPKDTTAQDLTV
jgi:hypothetical protein